MNILMVGAVAALLAVPLVGVISFLEDISPSFRRTVQLILIKKTLDYSVVPEEQGFEFDSYIKKKYGISFLITFLVILSFWFL